MMTDTATCRWNPTKHAGRPCPYHDALTRMDAASKANDYLAYEQARNDADKWKKVDSTFSKKLKSLFTSQNEPPAPEQPAPYQLVNNTVVLPNGQTFIVFDDEDQQNEYMSSFYCKNCMKHLSDTQADDLIASERVVCCGKNIWNDSAGLAIRKSSLWMLDPVQYQTKELSHFTAYIPKKDWEKDALTQPNLYIHLGEPDVGQWRMRDKLFNSELKNALKSEGRTFFREYSIKVKDVPSALTVEADTDSMHKPFYSPENTSMTDRFHLYVNAYEAPGSLSLAVTPNHIQVTGKKVGYVRQSGSIGYDEDSVKP